MFWIRDNGVTAFYGADNLPNQSYLKLNAAYKTDYDGRKAMEQRKRWETQAKEQKWKILLYHDIKTNIVTHY
ncbi:hypothetical protein HYN86_12350 [Flavobacterium fluviale]|uniref:Uncharacterized protein n=1 Tax=Flavobacterium fluviale TaxID=2249356 RepID=A0A344LTU7_9FLAO|nr:hypothetical protein HYN86_12350 [Flavobacterium fluviale]